MWDTVTDAGTRSPEEAAAPLKQGYNICRIYENVQTIKNSSLTAFHKAYKMSSNSTTP